MIHTQQQENSEQALMTEIYALGDAGVSVLQVRTREPGRTVATIRKSIITSESTVYSEWDLINGNRTFDASNYTNNLTSGDKMDIAEALERPLTMLRDKDSSISKHRDKIHYFVYLNAHPFIAGNPYPIELMQYYASTLAQLNVCVLLITPDITMHDIPAGTILIADMKTPSADELQDSLVRLIAASADDFDEGSELDEDDVRQISYLGLGLSLFEFETYAAIAIVNSGLDGGTAITMDAMLKGISQGKTAVVKQSEILELYPSASMDDVGGMSRLKDWVGHRANCYSDEAIEFGIEPPKGMVLVGPPGTGKSLCAKAVSSTLGVPLVRMDFGRVFSKFVGDSESRVRAALQMVEDMAPCVLFVDEIDKGLGGIGGGGNDSGTSSRVLGSFLTWLQDCNAPVFCMVTANRVDGLPPELTRRGRFDAVFSTTLPNADERAEILRIHLEKRNKPSDYDSSDMDAFETASHGYVPAEIESAVKEGLILAFNSGEELEMMHILKALKDMVPMSVSYKAQFDAMVEWSKNNATPVNYDEVPDTAAAVIANASAPVRRVTRRPR